MKRRGISVQRETIFVDGIDYVTFKSRDVELIHLMHVREEPHHPQTYPSHQIEPTCKTREGLAGAYSALSFL